MELLERNELTGRLVYGGEEEIARGTTQAIPLRALAARLGKLESR